MNYEFSKYPKGKRFFNRKHDTRKSELHKRFKTAYKDFEKITEMIKCQYNPTRIYQRGLLLDENKFSEISDIDIAIKDIKSAKDNFELYCEATKTTEFPLNIVEIEKTMPEYAESIKQTGKLIYEK